MDRTVLTHRQRRILVLRLTGHSGDEIGAMLGITRHTVYLHLLTVKARLGLYTPRDLFLWAYAQGLIAEWAEGVGDEREVA
jgi:DNA-binding CsgD family transcriptional regulator